MQSNRADVLKTLFEGCIPLRGLIGAGLCRLPLAADLLDKWCMLEIGDFLICGGEAGLSPVQLRRLLQDKQGRLLYDAHGSWRRLMQTAEIPFCEETRWAFAHDVQPEDDHLRSLLKAHGDCTVVPIEGDLIRWCRTQPWARDFVSQFTDEAYAAQGLGVLVRSEGSFAAGAGSYAAYPGGIEVQVETREAFQGRGLATVAAAALILRGHERGLRVTWDAANPASARIAEKLGYVPRGAYTILGIQ